MVEKISKIEELKNKLHHLMDCLDVDGKEKELDILEKKTGLPDFWKDTEIAKQTQQEISSIKEEIENIEKIKKELEEIEALEKISGNDAEIADGLKKKYDELEKALEKQEIKTFLSGKYDKNNAILEIFSGAGGQDSQDWATMLLRMYEKYCAKKGFEAFILHQSFGEAGGPEGRIGIKSATLEIRGSYAYGILKKETGVHRLVRISPFSAQKLRHTSFALVEVLPEIKIGDAEIEIKPEDLKVDTFRASGPGGQYVNKRESAIRITHLPTGIVVSSQSERLQGKNRDNAMKVLYAKLYQLKESQHAKKIKEIKGSSVSASWGNQIRSYVLHPYKLVKDLRTQVESSNAEGVLNGELDQFLEAEIKNK
ncbi:MAG: peptide chain release factor 2 [Candidatus Staskawiczbacteria bacterium]|nr:peptide chain release factor 2 [Candidatus Staskawiczbacteria bacterium]